MAHQEQIEYCLKIKKKYPEYFQKKLVLDVGSLDINGNNHYLFEDCLYLGVDVAEGRNVDIVCLGSELKLPDATFDTIISTECFEHDRYYPETLKNIYRMLKPGGLFIFTCATTGRAEHGTRRSSPGDAPLLVNYEDWQDYYKNINESDIREVLDLDGLFSEYGFEVNNMSHDLYFYGIKVNALRVRDDYSFIIYNNRLQIELEQTRTELECKIMQIAEIERINAEKELEILQLRSEIDKVLNSRSWKITKPLRIIGTFLRRYGFTRLKF
ncbi:MAG: methyltransferase domain-containing protein [Negativicutes bacterium]|jgi:SAM-dependent methyltransferase